MRHLWISLALLGSPALCEPVLTTGYLTRCVSDSCEIVVNGVFAYAEAGLGTPTDVMIGLYDLGEGVFPLRLTTEILPRDDGFADLIVEEFAVLPDDAVVVMARSLQGQWIWSPEGADGAGPIIEIEGLIWTEKLPDTPHARWKIALAERCPDGAKAGTSAMVFTLTPWRDEPARLGCWEIAAQSDAAITLRDLTRPDLSQSLRPAP